MGYLFVGVQGIDQKGDNVIVQSYFTPDGEGAEPLEEVLAKTKALASELKLNIKQVVSTANSGNGSSTASDGSNTDVAKIGSFAIRMQQNVDKNTHEVTETPAVVLYPLWNRDGSYGKFSVTTAFLNYPEDIAAFQAWLERNGVTTQLEDFPVYDGEGSPPRVQGITKKWEIVLPQTAEIKISKSPYTKPDGTDGTRTKLVAWL